tara:strand:+ start:110 stop:343 length:234 start_codon:yes stop_codon:yes gene_type:complete
MLNIYDRLKTEYKDKLENSCAKYSTASRLKYVLLSKTLWYELTIDQVKDVITYTDESNLNMSAYDFLYGDKFLIKDE